MAKQTVTVGNAIITLAGNNDPSTTDTSSPILNSTVNEVKTMGLLGPTKNSWVNGVRRISLHDCWKWDIPSLLPMGIVLAMTR